MSSRDHPDWWEPMGGQNSQDSILERRSLVWNDNGVVDRALFPILGTDAVFKGKFFTRGCRGKIEEIQIYRTATAAGTITLRISPHPCLGPLYEVVIPAGPANAWTGVTFEEMWNYDSLFIWVYTLEAGEEWGYDAVLPYDGHESSDAGATWADLAIRPFIRAVYTGETPGDVPVSGIINNVPIPYASSSYIEANVPLVQNVARRVTMVEGPGYCDFIIFHAGIGAHADDSYIQIYCDGLLAYETNFFQMNHFQFVAGFPSVTLGRHAVDGECVLLITKKFEFRRILDIWAINLNGPAQVGVWVLPTLMR